MSRALKSFSQFAAKEVPATFDLMNRQFQMWLLTAAIVPALLFIVLSPGLALNLPMNPKTTCAAKIPYPLLSGTTVTSASTTAGTGLGYIVDGVNGCDDATPNVGIAAICTARKQCRKIWNSGYTSYASIFLHAFVFAVLLATLGMTVRRYVK